MRTRDHPRRCGENCLEGGFRQGALGSPPQVRGKLGVRARCRLHDRITPAGAGKTVDKWELVRMIRDHPRRCGENGISGRETELTQGSPPRMRGKPKEYTDKQDVAGITPADAGKTSVKGSNRNNYWDHPRGCGENFSVIPCPKYGKGSPPRMRGKPFCGIGIYSADRITPADAGKTVVFLFYTTMCRDHPRGCGENICCCYCIVCGLGSPPRMRGKHAYSSPRIEPLRITPADAGKTLHQQHEHRRNRDHPRGCGENLHSRCAFGVSCGSPPRMRGKQNINSVTLLCGRITPADAGKTAQPRRADSFLKDHPRGCGENLRPRTVCKS